MGANNSRSNARPRFGFSEANLQSIFDVGYEEVAISKEYESEMIKKYKTLKEKPFMIPSDTLVSDIMIDPATFTKYNTPYEVWNNVLIPLFQGNPESSPILLQIIREYFKFVKERSLPAFEQEDRIRNDRFNRQSEDQRSIGRKFKDLENIQPVLTKELVATYQKVENVLLYVNETLKSFRQNDLSFRFHSSFELGSDFIIEQLKTKQNVFDVFQATEYGFKTSELSPIIAAFTESLILSINGNKQSVKNSLMTLANKYMNLPVINAAYEISSVAILGVNDIEGYKLPKQNVQSIITCDGKSIFLIGNHGYIHSISLSKSITNAKIRFSAEELKMEKTERVDLFAVFGNDHLLIHGPYSRKVRVICTDPRRIVDEDVAYQKSFLSTSPKIQAPTTSDGYFIYSTKGKSSINVFTIENNTIALHHTVDLKMGYASPNEYLGKDIIPSQKETIMLSNGVILSFLVMIKSHSGTDRFDYVMRQFSLIDGNHIRDIQFPLKFLLMSATVDPWNKCIWGLSQTEDNLGKLIKFRINGSLPPWLTGTNIDNVSDLDSIMSSFASAKDVTSLSMVIFKYLRYYISHFCGSGFNINYVNNNDTVRLFEINRFFAPSTNAIISTLVDSLKRIKSAYTNSLSNGKWNVQRLQEAMVMIVNLLDFNLTNFVSRILPNGNIIKIQNPHQISEELFLILKDKEFGFLYTSIAFTFVNSFDLFFNTKVSESPFVMQWLIENMKPSFLTYMLERFSTSNSFPYSFVALTCRKIFPPILKRMSDFSTYDLRCYQKDLVTYFIRSIMFEMRKVYSESPTELQDKQKQLQEAFHTFSGLMTEEMIRLLQKFGNQKTENQDKLQFLPFTRVFMKWLMLLHPFSSYTRVSTLFVSLFQPLFSEMSARISCSGIDKQVIEQKGSFVFIYMLYYELFSLYISFITALIDGGQELSKVLNYKWLIQSTLSSNLSPSSIDEIMKTFFQSLKPNSLLRKGFSFASMKSTSTESSRIEGLIQSIVQDKETSFVTELQNALYQSVPNPQNKKLTVEERHNERLLFAVFSKHLGIGQSMVEISNIVASNEKPIINHFIKLIVNAVYKIRRYTQQAKQKWNLKQKESEESQIPVQPGNEDDYPNLILEIRRKCVFLLHISPPSRFQTDDNDTVFTDTIAQICSFLSANISLKDFFDLIKTADQVQKHISTGLGIINNTLEQNLIPVCTSYIMEHFSRSTSIPKFLMALSDTPQKLAIESIGFKNILRLMNIIRSSISSNSQNESPSILFVFFANLIFSVSAVSPNTILDPLCELTESLVSKKSQFTQDQYNSFLCFITSSIYVIMQKNPQLKESLQNSPIIRHIDPEANTGSSKLSLGRLVFKSGLQLAINPESLFSIYCNSNPSMYHNTTSFLFDIIHNDPRITFIFQVVLNTIATICYGGYTSFFASGSNFDDQKGELKRTPGIIMAGCSELIQLCRRFFITADSSSLLLSNIFQYILTRGKSDSSSKELSVFSDPKLLYAVFAVLSNVIDSERPGSFLKDQDSGSIYYLCDIDRENGDYMCYKIPITPDSQIVTIPRSNRINPLTMIPFNYSMYTLYDSLIPHYLNHLNSSQKHYSDEGLSFYVLSSLKEYSSSADFLSLFMKVASFEQKPYVVFNSSENDFLNIIRNHLSSKNEGFYSFRNQVFRFYQTTPTIPTNGFNNQLYDGEINVDTERSLFLTPPCSDTSITKLNITVMSNLGSSYIGFVSLNIDSDQPEYFLVKYSKDKAVILDKTTTQLSNVTSLSFIYNPLNFEASIFVNGSESPVLTHKFVDNNVSYYIESFDVFKASYSFDLDFQAQKSHVSINKSKPIAQIKAKTSFPLYGKTVFRKSRPPILFENEDSLQNSDIPNVGVQVMGQYEVQLDHFRQKFYKMEYKPISVSKITSEPLVVYSQKSLEFSEKQLSVFDFNTRIYETPAILTNEYQKSQPIIYDISDKHDLYEVTDKDTTCRFVKSSSEDLISDSLGITKKHNPSHQKIEIKTGIPINPNYYYMHPELLNYFATGYSSKMRSEVNSVLFLNQIIIPGNDICNIFKQYSMNSDHIAQYFCTLLICSEAYVENTKVVDFSYNLFDSSCQTRRSDLYPQMNAISVLYNYYSQSSNCEEFVSSWHNLLSDRFNDFFWHFAIDKHPDIILVRKQTSQYIYKPGVKSYIAMEVVMSNGNYDIISNGSTNRINSNYTYIKESSFTVTTRVNPVILIPVDTDYNHTYLYTVIEVVTLFKYFILFINKLEPKYISKYKASLYSFIIDSLVAKSPFYTVIGEQIFSFLNQNVPIHSKDYSGALLQRLNFISQYLRPQKSSFFYCFLEEQQNVWDERVLIPLKKHFPEFISEKEFEDIKNSDSTQIGIPSCLISTPLTTTSDTARHIQLIRRVLRSYDSLIGFPFHFLIPLWCRVIQKFPPYESKQINSTVLKVQFNTAIPSSFKLMFKKAEVPPTVTISNNSQMENSVSVSSSQIPYDKNSQFFIQIPSDSWSSFDYYFESLDPENEPVSFILGNTKKFTDTIREAFIQWNPQYDSTIISQLSPSLYTTSNYNSSFDYSLLVTASLPFPLHSLVLRASLVLMLNWMIYNNLLKIDDPNITGLSRSIAPPIKLKKFHEAVLSNSGDVQPSLSIDRKAAFDVREGISNTLSNTVISQMSSVYNPSRFRNPGERPWRVELSNERGIDVGGPARDLVVDCARDLMSPSCGLVIPVPNARNECGAYRDTFVPFPNPRHSSIEKQYKFAGALIGICIRSGLVQDFTFPPLVWEFLSTNKVHINRIYEIDHNFKSLIETLKDAMTSGMTQEEFSSAINQKFVVTDINGVEIALTSRGKSEAVTLENCNRYISLAIDYRVKELQTHLQNMYTGFWENLNMTASAAIDGATIKYAACGDSEISYEALKNITSFSGIDSEQERIILRVFERFSNEQRSDLLKFTTGRIRLPPNDAIRLQIDNGGDTDRMPTASTCFNQLHVPRYSSFDKAYRLIGAAAKFTGAIENS